MQNRSTVQKSKYKWWVLFLCCMTNIFAVGLSWMSLPVLFTEISQKMGFSMSQLFVSWGMIPLAIIVFCIPAGLLVDKFGIRRIIGSGIMICAFFGALRGLSLNYPMFMALLILYGCGVPFTFIILPKAIASYFPVSQLAMGVGFLLASYGLGAGSAAMFSGTLFSDVLGGWRNVLFLWGGISVLIGILWLLTIRDKKERYPGTKNPPHNTFFLKKIVTLLSNPGILIVCIIFFLYVGGWLGAAGTLPVLLHKTYKMDIQQANGVISVVLWLYIVGALLLPAFSDYIGLRRPVISIGIIIAGISMFMVFISPNALIWLWTVIWGISFGVIPIIWTIPLELPDISSDVKGIVMALVNTVGNIGGVTFPLIIGFINTNSDFKPTILYVGILCAFGGLCLNGLLIWTIPETGRRKKENK